MNREFYWVGTSLNDFNGTNFDNITDAIDNCLPGMKVWSSPLFEKTWTIVYRRDNEG